MSVPIIERLTGRTMPELPDEAAHAIQHVYRQAEAARLGGPALRDDPDIELYMMGFKHAVHSASRMDVLLATEITLRIIDDIANTPEDFKNVGHAHIARVDGLYATVQAGRRLHKWAERQDKWMALTEKNQPYSPKVVAAGAAFATALAFDARSNRAWRRVMRDFHIPDSHRSYVGNRPSTANLHSEL